MGLELEILELGFVRYLVGMAWRVAALYACMTYVLFSYYNGCGVVVRCGGVFGSANTFNTQMEESE